MRFLFLLLICHQGLAQDFHFSTRYATITIGPGGYINSIRARSTKKEYCPAGDSSALLSLYKDKMYIQPGSATFDAGTGLISLLYPNGSTAVVKIEQRDSYLRLTLVSLSPRNGVDNIVWGPYKTSIHQTIGEIISTVRDNDFSIGMLALDMATTSGPPSEGDLPQTYYLIHAAPGVKLPPDLHEGQLFNTGGDSLGTSDIAFYSRPEEYFHYMVGNGAMLEPYGSDIVLHARDRRIPQIINFKPARMSPDRHQYVPPIDVDFIGSQVAFFGCPEPSTLNVIEKIELHEGLPHPTIDGRWVKDPLSAKPFIAWYGAHDSAISYARQLGFKAIQDEELDEYYYNPADKWNRTNINFSTGTMGLKAFTAMTNKAGIAFGLHTLCEFIQRESSDVTPVPDDHLCTVGSTVISHDIDSADTVITITDPTFFRESGGWEDIHTNVVKLGKELIGYDGVSGTPPYTLLNPKRGWDKTVRSGHHQGDTVSKLMPNAYQGFAPDIYLQDTYAEAYAQLLNEGGMDYIDFDGLESCWYQGQGQYSIKRFYDRLFKGLHHYIRNTGSCIFEGNWHYMSSLDVGGNLFNPVSDTFSIEGKDMRQTYFSNLLHVSFGVVPFESYWDEAAAENLETKAIGWDGQYMLGLRQKDVEKCSAKNEVFRAIRNWEGARDAGVFTARQKAGFRVLENRYHLEQTGPGAWNLYRVKLLQVTVAPRDTGAGVIINPFLSQPLRFVAQVTGTKGSSLSRVTIRINHSKKITLQGTVIAGQYIVCSDDRIFVTDDNWNRLSPEYPIHSVLGAGKNEIAIVGIPSEDLSSQLHLTFSAMGLPEKLKR